MGDEVEEGVVIRVCGQELVCFASLCPFAINIGSSYYVELIPTIFSGYEVGESIDGADSFIMRTGTAFGHLVSGKLVDGSLEACGLLFEDEVLRRDFCYLNGKMVTFRIDRLDVAFVGVVQD